MSELIPAGQATRKQADEKFCHSCGRLLHHSARSCPNCGAEQSGAAAHPPAATAPPAVDPNALTSPAPQPPPGGLRDAVYCRGCGQNLHTSARTCPHCGAVQAGAKAGASGTKSRVVAGLLAIFLGGLGVHRFYTGHIVLGLVYLVFFWTWIPAIIALVEAILFFTARDDEEFTEKYCA